MSNEPRTITDLVLVTAIARHTPGDRSGLLQGDLVLSFGDYPPSKLIADSDLLLNLKSTDWMLVMRGTSLFRLNIGDGLEGCDFDVAPPAENVVMPAGTAWPIYWGATQTSGAMVLVPDDISVIWSIVPPLLFARFRSWHLLVGLALVWSVALVQGAETFAVAYLVSVALAIVGGPSLIREAAEKQGYVHHGTYAIPSHMDAAAIELQSEKMIRKRIRDAQLALIVHEPAPPMNRGGL